MNILFVTVSTAAYDTGGTIYSYGIMDRVASYSCMDVLTYDEPEDPNYNYYNERLRGKVRNIYKVKMTRCDLFKKYFLYRTTFLRYSAAMCAKLEELIGEKKYDIIIMDHLRMAFPIDIVKKGGCKIVIIQHNIETANYNEQLKLKGHLKYHIKNYGLPLFEKQAMEKADAIWCITDKDKAYFKSIPELKQKPMFTVTPYFPYQRKKTNYTARKQLVITGSMNWYPNIEGVEWFATHVFKKILERDGEYKLYIVGRNPDEKILRLASENIIVTGEVSSVDPYLIESDLLLVPNKLGGGAKIKIIEGIFKGIPVVVLRPSIAGYEDLIPDEAFIVDNEDEYVKAVLSINDDTKRKELFVDQFIKNAIKASDISGILAKMA